jgi:hypothetical protein
VNLKYVKGSPICYVMSRYNHSPVWSDLLKVRPIYLNRRLFKINNGQLVSFCLDRWLGDKPLCQYPVLFELCVDKESSVYQVQQEGWVLRFRIQLPNMIRAQWYDLVNKINHVVLSDEKYITI